MKPADKHIVYLFVLALAGLCAYLPCHAQAYQDSNMKYDFNYIFRSRVVNDSTLMSIRDCHIINKTQRTATVSDAYGGFKITANAHDSIYFSALGYETLTIALADSMYDYGYIIRLKPKVYELGEVTVRPFVIELPTISPFEIYTPPLPNQGGINIPTGFSPITFFYNRFSKEGKQKRHYEKVKEGTADYMLIGEKFNGPMVAQLTGLKDDELIAFMSFCNFSNDFIMNYSMETIKRAIRKKFQEYSENQVK